MTIQSWYGTLDDSEFKTRDVDLSRRTQGQGSDGGLPFFNEEVGLKY